jgi:hypothetical protein
VALVILLLHFIIARTIFVVPAAADFIPALLPTSSTNPLILPMLLYGFYPLSPSCNPYMKTFTTCIIACAAIALLPACKKELSAEHVVQVQQFKAFVLNKKFQISEYYSDRPIDYNESDSVITLETDLWKYVSGWLKDDFNTFDFNANTVSIEQNARKIPGNNAPIIVKPISLGEDSQGAFFNFLDYRYNPFTYRLVEMKDDYFLVCADWHSGAKVFTKFSVISK